MLIQLPEERKNEITCLFKKRQPNASALWSYFNGTMTGKTYVDDLNAPTKAICQLDMSWTYISDDADFAWIEEILAEIIKITWIQVIWTPERRGQYPLKDAATIIPRNEYTERGPALAEPRDVEIAPFCKELLEKLPWADWHISVYGTAENFLNKTFGFYAVDNGVPVSEAEAAFSANGWCEIGIITVKEKRRMGYAFASCLRLLEEIENRGMKAIWACDKENSESDALAKKLGFINPVEYDFIYFPHQHD